jgi:Na+/H+ antiporter NhaD/arsenite permease-like protein
MSLAYIAASLDATGVFAWLAHHITKLSKGQGPRLFFLYSALSAVITALTGNDTSIMTITPIIIYFARSTKCDPMVSRISNDIFGSMPKSLA